MKSGNLALDHFLNKIENFEDFVNHFNGDDIKNYDKKNIEDKNNPQPVRFEVGIFDNPIKYINLSVCRLDLELINYGPEVLQDFKIYLEFKNVLKADVVSKCDNLLDAVQYPYNIVFKDKFNAEFISESTILVQKDSIKFDTICFKVEPTEQKVLIDWRLVARDYQYQGDICLRISPILESEERVRYVDSPNSYAEKKTIVDKYKFT